MLLNTFQHLQGVGPARERSLWTAGCTDWRRFLERPDCSSRILPGGLGRRAREEIASDLELLRTKNVALLAKRLPRRVHWRLVRHFSDRVGFLDIETTGLSKARDRLTTVGLWSPTGGARVLVRGFDLDDLQAELDRIGILVTFHGAAFDLPFLKAACQGLVLPPAHVDLRHLAAATGLRGGLKAVERVLGIGRSDAVEGLDGSDAARLWHRWEGSLADRAALQRLVEYNLADVLNLRPLLAACINRLLGSFPKLDLEPLPTPVSGAQPARVDALTGSDSFQKK